MEIDEDPSPQVAGTSFTDDAAEALNEESNAPETSFTADLEALLHEDTENKKGSDATEDVSWDEIPKALQHTLQRIIEQGSVYNPDAREFIRSAKGEGDPDLTLGVNLELFRKRLHEFAAEKKLPHHTITQLKEHWPLSGPL